jgi:hypothetical protein
MDDVPIMSASQRLMQQDTVVAWGPWLSGLVPAVYPHLVRRRQTSHRWTIMAVAS